MDLEQEASSATEILSGKVVAKVFRHRVEEVCIEVTDGTRIFVDQKADGIELSITNGAEE